MKYSSVEGWLTNVLQERSGRPVRFVRQSRIPFKRGTSLGRSYWRYKFRVGDSDVLLFVKCGESAGRNPELEAFMGGRDEPALLTPGYYGAVKISGAPAAAWDYIPGRSPRFSTTNPRYLARVVDVVATINAIEPPAFIPKSLPWIAPVSERAATLLEQNSPDDGQTRRRLDQFAKVESALIERASAMDRRWLSHHDVKSQNMILRSDRRIAVIDWTSATVSAAGMSLRFLARFDAETKRALVERYVKRMRRAGHDVRRRDVLFMVDTAQLFWGLSSGVWARREARIRQALAIRWGDKS